jgi:uncharacterized protein (TIGR00251 family)
VFDNVVTQTKQGQGLLRIYVQPRSSRDRICGIHGDSLKVAISAPPLEGRANKAVILLFSKLFSLRRKDLTLSTGEQSRFKTLLFSNLSAADIKELLLPYIESP